jgi:hypothetical protein
MANKIFRFFASIENTKFFSDFSVRRKKESRLEQLRIFLSVKNDRENSVVEPEPEP